MNPADILTLAATAPVTATRLRATREDQLADARRAATSIAPPVAR